MFVARLKLGSQETELAKSVTTIGRTSDNDIAIDDSNVSRVHAEIERRGEDYILIDLNSSNGTAVNENALTDEIVLNDGDTILFGGSAEATFLYREPEPAEGAERDPSAGTPGTGTPPHASSGSGDQAERAVFDAEYAALQGLRMSVAPSGGGSASAAASTAASSSGASAAVSGSDSIKIIAAVACGIALLVAVGVGVFYLTRGSSCNAKASLVSPESGDTISQATALTLNVSNGECVAKAVISIDGEAVATAAPPEFSASVDPADHPDLADGADHSLTVTLTDASGNVVFTTPGTMLAFETRKVAPPATPAVANSNTEPASKPSAATQLSLVQIQQMCQAFVKQFSGGFSYNISNKQFLQDVQKRTADYAVEGYSQRAAVYRDTINLAFVSGQNLDPALGFVLAMSRSKFVPAKQGDLEGLWQMSNTFVTDNKYNGQCGTETLSDKSQNCAARAAAMYMKTLVFDVFKGDVVYSVAAFGKTAQDAAAWSAALPANRSDIGSVVKTQAEREQVIRFFAAGIVAENPQRFGLSKDTPLSSLYPH
ncbi:MAG: FHA domain-containing protein [Acidobacteria bacterium]|nr:FHA domain-containing protein [Acidobacteriota bacterium]